MDLKKSEKKDKNYIKWSEPNLIKLSDPLAYGAVCSNGTAATNGCSTGSAPTGGCAPFGGSD